MADITMCLQHNCILKDLCYRYTAPKNDFLQLYFVDDPRTLEESINTKEYCGWYFADVKITSNKILNLLNQSKMTKFNINDSATFENGSKHIYVSCDTEDATEIGVLRAFISDTIETFQEFYTKEADENKG